METAIKKIKKGKTLVETFLKKYFFVVPKPVPAPDIPENANWAQRFILNHKRLVGMLIPMILFHFVWWSICIKHGYLIEFVKRYRLSISIIFEATGGGITAVGGGVIAFPVLAIGLKASVAVARDFSIMLQSIPMLSGAFLTIWMGSKLEWHYLVFCSLGQAIGNVVGLEIFDSLVPAMEKKLVYASLWFTTVSAFLLMQRNLKSSKFYDSIPDVGVWHSITLTIIGFIGGVSSAFYGVDFITYSIRALLFKVNEKVAVPTSIVLMAINVVMGFYWRQFLSDSGVEIEAWKYLVVIVPFVAIFGPFGSFLAMYLHQYVKIFIIFALSTSTLVSVLCVSHITLKLGIMVGGLLVGGFVFFLLLHFIGERLNKSFQSRYLSDAGSSIQISTSIKIILDEN